MIDIIAELGRRLEALECQDDAHRAALALSSSLSREDISDWLSRYPTTKIQKNILIITAGNIPFVGVHDLLCVLAAGHRAMVRPSSRDADRMAWIVAQLLDIEPALPVVLIPAETPIAAPDAVVAMGGGDAARVFREKFTDAALLLRGHRSSLAVLDGNEALQQLAALADDVLSYSGLGCRNVSLIFVPRGYDFSALGHALSQHNTSAGYRNNYRQARALLTMSGTPFRDCNTCLLRAEKGFSTDVSILNYAFYDALPEVMLWVADHDSEIQCVVGPLSHPRRVDLGRAQYPTLLDYPDGCDTMEFLLSI